MFLCVFAELQRQGRELQTGGTISTCMAIPNHFYPSSASVQSPMSTTRQICATTNLCTLPWSVSFNRSSINVLFILGREAFHFMSMLFASLYLPSGVHFFLIFHDYSQPALETRGRGGHFEQFGGAEEPKAQHVTLNLRTGSSLSLFSQLLSSEPTVQSSHSSSAPHAGSTVSFVSQLHTQ